jgi:hypothetical protein
MNTCLPRVPKAAYPTRWRSNRTTAKPPLFDSPIFQQQLGIEITPVTRKNDGQPMLKPLILLSVKRPSIFVGNAPVIQADLHALQPKSRVTEQESSTILSYGGRDLEHWRLEQHANELLNRY